MYMIFCVCTHTCMDNEYLRTYTHRDARTHLHAKPLSNHKCNATVL